MKTELSFLMELFLNDEVPKPIKAMVADRIREVEKMVATATIHIPSNFQPPSTPSTSGVVSVVQQSPSMQRIMERHPEVPVVTVAAPTTPAAAQALAARAALLATASSEKPEPGRTGKRKF